MPAKVVTSFNFEKEEKEEIARSYETGQAHRIEVSGFSRAFYQAAKEKLKYFRFTFTDHYTQSRSG